MNQYLKLDAWRVIEDEFHPEYNEITESIFSLGNGRMGQRGSFEETYTGKSLQGNYVAGIYYPDKTRVGWWKNGYPAYFAKVLNAANWTGIEIKIQNQVIDLHTCHIDSFYRELNMKEGYILRTADITLKHDLKLRIKSIRFNSMCDDESGAISYSITPLNFSSPIDVKLFVDGNVKNKDSNYDEIFWEEVYAFSEDKLSFVISKTKKTDFHVFTGQVVQIFQNGIELDVESHAEIKNKYAAISCSIIAEKDQTIEFVKYAVNLSSENHPKKELKKNALAYLDRISKKGFQKMLADHVEVWSAKWAINDIKIEGDIAAQQGIRFNIFQLNQTYTGEDDRLNIGPKGFTGEKYGGSTYWDTEAYCIPFYLATAPPKIAKNLLIYRWRHLNKAIENAKKLGFDHGAALFPMVTMNGEECHNEWEITFEEIHRNGAIAFAIHDYVNYTNDRYHLVEYGWDVLLSIARFWAQRVNWSENINKYVILGVTGPNEYENNVNNNWYTNYLAAWCLRYVSEVYHEINSSFAQQAKTKFTETNFQLKELENFTFIANNMYFPFDQKNGIFLQQDGFLDKTILPVGHIPENQKPIHQHWSWDRILRSCYIKQADVLQGFYFFTNDFSLEELERNYQFYEPLTVHESSLSPCVHSILAAKLGKNDKSYEFYNRAARLDLDNYNHDTQDGCHITSMAGTWMSIVKGFGGMEVLKNFLHFNPFLPTKWQSYSFKINFRENQIAVEVGHRGIIVTNILGPSMVIYVFNEPYPVKTSQTELIRYPKKSGN